MISKLLNLGYEPQSSGTVNFHFGFHLQEVCASMLLESDYHFMIYNIKTRIQENFMIFSVCLYVANCILLVDTLCVYLMALANELEVTIFTSSYDTEVRDVIDNMFPYVRVVSGERLEQNIKILTQGEGCDVVIQFTSAGGRLYLQTFGFKAFGVMFKEHAIFFIKLSYFILLKTFD